MTAHTWLNLYPVGSDAVCTVCGAERMVPASGDPRVVYRKQRGSAWGPEPECEARKQDNE